MKKGQQKQTDKELFLNVGEIDLPKINLKQYIGKHIQINKTGVYEGQYGLYVKIETDIVEKVGKGDNAINIRGSAIFGLQQDENGKWGYGKDTKLDQFLKRYEVKDVKELIGKEVILITNVNKDGNEFLTFN